MLFSRHTQQRETREARPVNPPQEPTAEKLGGPTANSYALSDKVTVWVTSLIGQPIFLPQAVTIEVIPKVFTRLTRSSVPHSSNRSKRRALASKIEADVIQAACFCGAHRSRDRSVASEASCGLIANVAGYPVRQLSVA